MSSKRKAFQDALRRVNQAKERFSTAQSDGDGVAAASEYYEALCRFSEMIDAGLRELRSKRIVDRDRKSADDC